MQSCVLEKFPLVKLVTVVIIFVPTQAIEKDPKNISFITNIAAVNMAQKKCVGFELMDKDCFFLCCMYFLHEFMRISGVLGPGLCWCVAMMGTSHLRNC